MPDTLSEQLRTLLTGPGPLAGEAVEALRLLLQHGWVEPDRVEQLLARDPLAAAERHPAVRSLAEDLAVARTRARTATARSGDLRRQADAALARSRDLQADGRRREEGRVAALEQEVAALRQEAGQLRRALESRPRIEHAVGIVMQLLGCDETAAWDLLSRLSQRTNVKVTVLAEALAARVAEGRGVPPEIAEGLRALAAGTWSTRSRT